MSNTPAPEPQQERKSPKKITVRRLDKIETGGVLQPSQGTSN
ncbi:MULTISPECIES: hypothetical protein [unclassified Nonomuraea]